MEATEQTIRENLRKEILLCGKSKSQIAAELGISERTLYRKLKEIEK